MSVPRPGQYAKPLEGIIAEATSALSALHMNPKPIPRLPNDESTYLADSDEWCRHACDHMQAVIDLALKALKKGGC
jgi:hypothetical protein